MRRGTTWNPAVVLLAVVTAGFVPDGRPVLAQNPATAQPQEQDQRYLIYVKGIT